MGRDAGNVNGDIKKDVVRQIACRYGIRRGGG